AFSFAGDLIAFEIDRADVVGLERAFADAGRRAEDSLLADAVRMISFVARTELPLPDPPADVAELFLDPPLADAIDVVAVAGSVAVRVRFDSSRAVRHRSPSDFKRDVCAIEDRGVVSIDRHALLRIKGHAR